ncbi:MAG TPA: hypothetical protein VGB32_05495 [Candidatus Bathyarchaeia archaeon]
MDKKYMLAALLLMGMTVISTMAFTITPSTEEAPNVYSYSTTTGDTTADSIKVKPWGSAKKVKIIIGIDDDADSDAFNLLFDLERSGPSNDFSGYTFTVSTGTLDQTAKSEGHIEVTGIADGTATVTLTVEHSSSSTYENLTALLVSVEG